MNKMNVAVYARKSVILKKGDTLNLQRQKCEEKLRGELCNKEINIVYYEDQKSGKNMDREEMQEMIQGIKQGKIKAVCSYKLDRLGRNAVELLNFLELLRKYNVLLVCVEDGIKYDPANEKDIFAKLMIMFMSIMAEMERNNIRQRVMDTKDFLARLGFWLGGTAPYGFKSVRVENDNLVDAAAKYLYMLKEEIDEMKVIKYIYEIYEEEEVSYGEIARRCEREGYTPRCRKKSAVRFDQRTIQGMLENFSYVKATPDVYDWLIDQGYSADNISSRDRFDGVHGLLSYGKRSQVEEEIGNEAESESEENTKDDKKSDIIIAVAPHLGQIEAKSWLAVQEKMKKRQLSKSRTVSRHNNVLITSDKFICGCCGGVISSFNRQSRVDKTVFYPHYRCENKRKNRGKLCDTNNISAIELDEKIVDAIFQRKKELIESSDYIRENLTLLYKKVSRQSAIPELEKSIKNIDREIVTLTDNFSKCKLGENLIARLELKLSELEERKGDFQRKIEEEKRRLSDIENRKLDLDIIADKLLVLKKDEFNQLGMSEKRAIVATLIDKVIWDGVNVHIYFTMPKIIGDGHITNNFFDSTACTSVDKVKQPF